MSSAFYWNLKNCESTAGSKYVTSTVPATFSEQTFLTWRKWSSRSKNYSRYRHRILIWEVQMTYGLEDIVLMCAHKDIYWNWKKKNCTIQALKTGERTWKATLRLYGPERRTIIWDSTIRREIATRSASITRSYYGKILSLFQSQVMSRPAAFSVSFPKFQVSTVSFHALPVYLLDIILDPNCYLLITIKNMFTKIDFPNFIFRRKSNAMTSYYDTDLHKY